MKTLAGINTDWIFSLMVGELIFRDECFIIVGLCMKVHRTLGKGFKEAVYKDALEIELQKAKIPYEREKKLR